jgi:hypothetical protein
MICPEVKVVLKMNVGLRNDSEKESGATIHV